MVDLSRGPKRGGRRLVVYLEAQDPKNPVGDILAPGRPLLDGSGSHSSPQVKEGALQRLSAKPGRKQNLVRTELQRGRALPSPDWSLDILQPAP